MSASPKSLVRTLLLLVVAGSLGYMVWMEIGGKDAGSSGGGDLSDAARANAKVVVYYLSEGKDCSTCERIEAYTQETLETHFADALASGELVWLQLDMDEPEHQHFVTDFKLYTKSIVLVELDSGVQVRFSNLEKVWDHVYDKPAFVEYMRENVADYLGAGQ